MRALLAALLLAAACARSAAEPAAQRIAYGGDPQQIGELRLPPGSGPFPVAVLIHGGCWRAGIGSTAGMLPIARALAAEGIASWNVEYRGVGDTGGGWPGTFLDVAAATDYVRTLAKTHPLDASRVIALGHSAGAHLALWDAARAKLPATSRLHGDSPLPLRGVVALGGPGDLRTLRADRVCGRGTLNTLLGGTPEAVPEHYADASPAAWLPLGVPQLLVTGSADRLIPTGLLIPYEEAARRAGDAVELREVEGADHGDLIAPGASAWRVVGPGVRAQLGLPAR